MNEANERLISIRNEQGRNSHRHKHRHGVLALVLATSLGAGIITAFVTLTNDATAQTTSKGQTSGTPGAPSSPDCGPDWIVVSSPYSGTNSYLTAVADVTVGQSSLVVGAGYFTNNSGVDRSLVQYWDPLANQWVVYPTPPLNQGTGDNHLTGVAVLSDEIWVVGNYINSSGVSRTLIEHTSMGSPTWTIVPSPNQGGSAADNFLTGVTAASATDLWAVGYYESAGIARTLVEHWNGSQWSIETTPNQGVNTRNFLNGVSAVSSGNVWAVGYYGPGGSIPDGHTLTLRRTGGTWSYVPSPDGGTSSGDRNKLLAVHALSANNISAVGYYYNSSGPLDHTLTLHWNGSAWSVRPSPSPGGLNYNDLYGVVGAQSGDIWAVGNYSDSNITRTLVEHWDGSAWSVRPSPSPNQSTFNVLYGVTAVSPNDIWAVGAYQIGGSYRTLVERYNPCSGTPTPTRTLLPTQTPGGPTATIEPSDTPEPQPTSCPIQFTDVPQGSTFYDFIRCLACAGIINGYPDGTFKPNNNVTRGQLSKIVANAAGFSDPQTIQMFEDVPVGSTFFDFIGRLASRGYIGGYACGGTGEPCNPPGNLPYFRTNNNATRGQIAKIDANAAGFVDPPVGQTFEDVAPASAFYTYTQRLTSRAIMAGYPCGGAGEPCIAPDNRPYFRPNNNATRGQTSKIVSGTFFPNCQTPLR